MIFDYVSNVSFAFFRDEFIGAVFLIAQCKLLTFLFDGLEVAHDDLRSPHVLQLVSHFQLQARVLESRTQLIRVIALLIPREAYNTLIHILRCSLVVLAHRVLVCVVFFCYSSFLDLHPVVICQRILIELTWTQFRKGTIRHTSFAFTYL